MSDTAKQVARHAGERKFSAGVGRIVPNPGGWRRLLLSLAIASLAVLPLYLFTLIAAQGGHSLDLIGLAFDFVQDKLIPEKWTYVLDRLPDDVHGSIKSLMGEIRTAVVVLALTVGLFRTRFIEKWDFILFSPFDGRHLTILPPYSGILRWAGAQHHQQEAWAALKAWAADGAGEWRSVIGGQSPEKPFSWSLLVGPNGQGKTQLGIELARSLVRQGEDESAEDDQAGKPGAFRLALRRWWNRGGDASWDAGIVSGWSEADWQGLREWRPRRPTLLILDDPLPRAAAEVLKNLLAVQNEFRYPVRLLIIDQSVPTNLDLRFDIGGGQWTAREEGAAKTFGCLVRLEGVKFSREACGALALSEVEGGQNDAQLKQLWQMEQRDSFWEATGGHPLIVALGALWLADASHQISDLTGRAVIDAESELTRSHVKRDLGPAAHRLIVSRAEEMLETVKSAGFNSANHLEALACATLAGGIPWEAARKTFQLGNLFEDLAKAFPHAPEVVEHQGGAGRMFPPVRPAFVAEVVLTTVVPNLLQVASKRDFLREIAQKAWVLNPEGMMNTLLRHAWSDSGLISAIQAIPHEIADPELAIRLAEVLCESATRRYGPVGAALAIIGRLNKLGAAEQAARLADYLAHLARQPDCSVPVAILLFVAVLPSLPPADGKAALGKLGELLRQAWKGRPVSAAVISALDAEALSVLEKGEQEFARLLLAGIDSLEACQEARRNFLAPMQFYFPDWRGGLGILAAGSGESPLQSAFCRLVAFRLACNTEVPDIQGIESAITLLPDVRTREWFLVDAWRYLSTALSLRGKTFWAGKALVPQDRAQEEEDPLSEYLLSQREQDFDAWDALSKVEAIVQSRPEYRDDKEMQGSLAVGYRFLACAFSQNGLHLAETRAAVAKVESIVSAIPEFLADREMRRELAESYRHLSYACDTNQVVSFVGPNRRIDELAAATARVESIVAERPEFTSDRPMQLELVESLRNLVSGYAKREMFAEAKAVLDKIEAITSASPEYAADGWLQFCRTCAFTSLACAYSNRLLIEECLAQVTKTEMIATARPEFAEDRRMQFQRLIALQALALACSSHGFVNETRSAVKKMQAIVAAHPLHAQDIDVQRKLANVYCYLSYALAMNGQVDETRAVVEKIKTIRALDKKFEDDTLLQDSLIRALSNLAYAAQRNGLIEETWTATESIGAIANSRGGLAPTMDYLFALNHLLLVYLQHGMTHEMQAVFEQRKSVAAQPSHESKVGILAALAIAYPFMAAFHANRGEAGMTQQLAEELDAFLITVPEVAENGDFQTQRALVWQHVAEARGHDDPLRTVEAAYQKVAAISRLFPEDEKLAGIEAAAQRRLVEVKMENALA